MAFVRRPLALILGLVACAPELTQQPSRGSGGDAPQRALLPSETGINLVAFVGRQVSIKHIPRPRPHPEPPLEEDTVIVQMDPVFEARYEVLQLVFGDYSAKEMVFRFSSHGSIKDFQNTKIALLYTSLGERGRYLQKYLYDPVFKNSEGVWAGCGASFEEEVRDYKLQGLRSVPMRFGLDASFDASGLSPVEVDERYPPEHYDMEGDRAFCITGATLADLFLVKRRGVLWHRGVFRN